MRLLPLLIFLVSLLAAPWAQAQPETPPDGTHRYERTDGTFDWDALERDLAPYRHEDGTLDWKAASTDRPVVEGAGLARFGMALFLKELAIVAKTGDHARIEEFYEGLISVDFFVHYGAFLGGVVGSEVAYARFLAQHIRPQFVRTLLRNNLLLATGLALSQLVGGELDGKTFAISLSSLGLSSTAVRAGLSSVEWVVDLRRARSVSKVAQLGRVARLLKGVGGWAYVAGELTVVLLTADAVEKRVRSYLDRGEARDAIADAGVAFLESAQSAGDAAAIRAATLRYAAAWDDYRNFLYRPLLEVESVLARRLERAARDAKVASDRRNATLRRLDDYPSLRESTTRRYGSTAAFADSLVAKELAALDRDLRRYAAAYDKARGEAEAKVYSASRRDTLLLADVDVAEALSANGAGRAAQRKSLHRALEDASLNRLETYDDEAEVLRAAQALLPAELTASLDDALARTSRTAAADSAVSRGELGGLVGALGQ